MRWNVGKYEYDAQTNVLKGPAGKKLLEPKVSALLHFFLTNTGRDINRDELIDTVWDGQIVTDGAINRVVMQLRKELGDDAKIKHMIVTVPKVGYRFVFAATELTIDPNALPTKQYGTPIGLGLVAAFLIAAALYFLTEKTSPEINQNANLSPLVRLTGKQSDAAYANKAGQLAYVEHNKNSATLYLAAKADAPALKLGQEADAIDAPTWSKDNSVLAYRSTESGVCEIRLVTFEGGAAASNQPVYQCKTSKQISLSFGLNAQKLYFTQQDTSPFGPYFVYELDLPSAAVRKLSQPKTQDQGNHQIDVNPTTGNILLIHDRVPGKTSAYELDVKTNTFERLFDWPYKLDYAIWGHSSDTIVHPGQHPSYSLLETNIKTGASRVLVSDSRRIKEPARIENGRDYLFTSYINNFDLFLGRDLVTNFNSSVMDYQATLSHDAEQLAFFSKRTGKSLIWVGDLPSGDLRSIQPSEHGRLFRAMSWADDNRRLLVTSDTGLLIFDAADGRLIKTINPTQTVYGANWISDNQIAYSGLTEGRWQLYIHDLTLNKTIQENTKWAFVLKDNKREVRLDQDLNIHENGATILGQTCAYALRFQDLTIRLSDGLLYCISQKNPEDVIQYNMDGNMVTHQGVLSGNRQYSVAKGRIAHTGLTSAVSDIMRTKYMGAPG